jgi:hypothetical protein
MHCIFLNKELDVFTKEAELPTGALIGCVYYALKNY